MSSGAFIIVGGTNDFKTFRLSFASKIVSEGVRLDVAVTLNSSIGGTELASIRARIPTAGALLVDCPIARAGGGRHYLFVVTPTIAPPPGTKFPATKQRIIAMVIDLLVLIVLVSGSQVAAQAVAKSQKPAIVHQIDELNDQLFDRGDSSDDSEPSWTR